MGAYTCPVIKDVFISLKIVYTLTNGVDPDKMPHFVVYHLGLYCFQSSYNEYAIHLRTRHSLC